jgi:BNR repeat-like domain
MTRSVSAVVQAVLLLVVMAAFLGAVVLVDRAQPAPAAIGGRGGPGAAEEDENEEAKEQAEKVERRLEAWERAERAGETGQRRPVAAAAAPAGWTGERPIDVAADDWEPAIAADPNGPWVYALLTRYASPKPCPGNCPTPHIALYVSGDNGATWSTGRPICACKGSGQFDPIVEVVPSNGAVYAVYMNGFNVVFVKSADHGQTWSGPVKTYGNVSWNDKPILAVSDDGRDVYVAFNGPTGGDPWLAQSHDAGATWSQTKLVDGDRYYYAFDGDVAADGTVYFAQSALLYGPKGKEGGTVGLVEHRVLVSRDRGATWENGLVDTVERGQVCVAAGCSGDYYLGHTVLSVDAAGRVAFAYDGATTPLGRQSIFVRRSTDGGRTWSGRVAVSTSGEMATTPAIESGGAGDVRVWWAETAGGDVDRWNVWYRRSADGGATWAAPVKLSDATGGAAYKTAAGFLEPYGDYGELAITSTGKAIAIWGEGSSYDGPGGVWYSREP